METLVQDAKKQLARFAAESEQNKQIIGRFDEVLTEKVNKQYIDLLKKEIGDNYVSNS